MVHKADQNPQKPKAPQDQCEAGGSDSEIAITPQMIEEVEREVAAWVAGAWSEVDHSLEALTRKLLAVVRGGQGE